MKKMQNNGNPNHQDAGSVLETRQYSNPISRIHYYIIPIKFKSNLKMNTFVGKIGLGIATVSANLSHN